MFGASDLQYPGMILANEPARISRIPASILPGISSPWTIQASMGESAGLKKYTSETTLAGWYSIARK